MKLLENAISFRPKAVKGRTITACLIVANKTNNNSRFYPKKVLERAVLKLQSKLPSRTVIGNLSHPETLEKLSDGAIIWESIWWNGNQVMGKGTILQNANGETLRSLIKAGSNIGVSQRAIGNVSKANKDGVQVVEDLEIISYDICCEPSFAEATSNIILEHKNKKPTTLAQILESTVNHPNDEKLDDFVSIITGNADYALKKQLNEKLEASSDYLEIQIQDSTIRHIWKGLNEKVKARLKRNRK